MQSIARVVQKARNFPEWIMTRPDLYAYYMLLVIRNMVMGWPGGSIVFLPEAPKRAYAIWKICQSLGVRPSRRFDEGTKLAVVWQDRTFRTGLPETFARLPVEFRVLNRDCPDISKTRVGKVFESVFKRSLTIDPKAYSGPCVEKSNGNGTHNGRVVCCPVEAVNAESFYQRLIDNQVELDGRPMVLDYRAVICGTRIPLVYKKYRPVTDRFSNTNSTTECAVVENCFSEHERAGILAFAREFGVDYAEIDVLRDRLDGQIYIVDVNYTPSGPPNHLPTRQGIWAIRKIASVFAEEFRV